MRKRFLHTTAAVAVAVREARLERGWTAARLAAQARGPEERTEVVEARIEDVEAGVVHHPEHLLRILEALDIHATALPSERSPDALERHEVDLKAAVERFRP